MSDTDDIKKPIGRPLKFDDPKKLQQQVQAYFDSCFSRAYDQFGNPIIDKAHPDYTKEKPIYVMRQTKPFTVAGLAVFLDTSRQTLVDYSKESHFPDYVDEATKLELIDTIKRAKEQIYAYTEERLFVPGLATGAIFSLKNNYSDEWKDKHEIGGDGTIIVKSVRYNEEPKDNGDGNTATV